jgi:hypothetical protein
LPAKKYKQQQTNRISWNQDSQDSCCIGFEALEIGDLRQAEACFRETISFPRAG